MGIKKDAMNYEKKIADVKYFFWKKYWWLFVLILLVFMGIYWILYNIYY